MYSYLKGTFAGYEDDKVIIDAGGVGYEISVPASVLAFLPEKGENIKLYVHQVVREDSFELVGFAQKEQKKIYMKLLGVSGVGPKAAISILSVLSPIELIQAVAANDYKAIARANGVGPKMAQKIVLELKGKVDSEALDAMSDAGYHLPQDSSYNEALQALTALGYQQSEAKVALKGTKPGTSSQLIRQALSNLGSKI